MAIEVNNNIIRTLDNIHEFLECFNKNEIDQLSLKTVVVFVIHCMPQFNWAVPDIELHPDGQMALTWRNIDGIINLAFGDGVVTWASYVDGVGNKGVFKLDTNKWRNNGEKN